MKSKFTIYLLIAVFSAIITTILYINKIDFLNSVDLKLKDVRFRIRGELKPDPRVLIVAIDSKSVDALGRWPWDRRLIARLVENMKDVKAIALDIVFSEPSTHESDKALKKALNTANTVTGYYFREEETIMNLFSYQNLRQSRIKLIKSSGNIEKLPVREFNYAELNIPDITSSQGFFNIFPDEDGVYRRINLLCIYRGELYPHLALQTLSKFKNSPVIVDVAEFGVKAIKVKDITIPVDESGRMLINYYGKAGSIKNFSAVDVIEGKVKLPQDSIVFVGATEMGIADIRSTPFDPVMPGVEISATAFSNIINKQYLINNAWVSLIDIFFITIPVVLVGIALSRSSKTFVSLIIFTVAMLVTYTLNLFIFKKYFFDLALLYPFLSLSLSYVTAEAYRNIVIEKKSRFLKKAFSSYVSKELVEILIKNPDALKLGGEKRTVTVLFSDIRSFTTIAEKLSPEKLVLLLNSYLDPMTKIVLKHKGMLDKYIGDAIMAVYNAPLDLPEHAAEAIFTALDMLKELKILNHKLNEIGLPEIEIGIGINTGEAITGNMGTELRFDYTVIGDTVNLASRLEGLNKLYGTRIIISETTFQQFKSSRVQEFKSLRVQVRKLDLIRVKGKKEPVRVFEVLEEDSPLKEAIKDFENALNLYRKCEFKEAVTIFSYLSAKFNDKASMLFKERCERYILNPPSEQWDGIYTHEEK